MFSNGYNGATFAIYNAKIVVDQASTQTEDSYDGSHDTALTIAAGTGGGQSFTAIGGNLTSMAAYFSGVCTGAFNVNAKLYAHSGTYGTNSVPTGAALATSDNVLCSSLVVGSYNTFTFSGGNQVALTNGTHYVITIEVATGAGASITWDSDNTSPNHSGNASTFNGASWSAVGSSDQLFSVGGSFGAFTLLEPQYLLAPSPLASGTSLQQMLSKYDTTEWSGVANTFLLQTDAAHTSGSTITTSDSAGGTTYATNSNALDEATSTFTCIPSTTKTVDTTATTNNNNVYSVRWLVDVVIGGGGGTSLCGAAAQIAPSRMQINGGLQLNSQLSI